MMKKLSVLLFVILVSLFGAQGIRAESQHVYIDDYYAYMSRDQYDQLNEDLEHIENDYDIGIYFILDETIRDTEEALITYTADFLNSHSFCANNIVLAMNTSYFSLQANGSAAAKVLAEEEKIFYDEFYSEARLIQNGYDDAFYKGIVNYYQYVTKIVNGTAYQTNAPIVTVRSFVYDYADVLRDSEEEELNTALKRVKDRYGFDALIVTVDSFNGMTAQDYSDDFYDYNNFADDGILLVLDVKGREWHISTKGRGDLYFTDYGVVRMMDKMQGDLSRDRYYEAFRTYSEEVDSYIRSALNGNIIDSNTGNSERRFGLGNITISGIFAAIVTFVTNLTLKGQLKSVKRQYFARDYIVSNSFYLTGASDMLVNRTVSRQPLMNRSSRPGGPGGHISSGGGTHVHTSSSGSTHGGHGGHF